MLIRPATHADADAIAAMVVEADATFTEFAEAGWTPPSYESEVEKARSTVAEPDSWTRIAEVEGAVVGYVSFTAATLTREPVDDPELAHLGRLFVRPTHWGAGVATALHAKALAAAAAQGFTAMRLFTPAAHGRARRFYEREGWHAMAGEIPAGKLGLALTEYRRAL
jgi:predicted N-acetyltransferase YhbS